MTLTDPNSAMKEADLQRTIVTAARDFGWLAYATFSSVRSEPGFPDLVLVRPPRLIFVECKTMKARLSKGRMNKAGTRRLPGQEDWAEALEACPGAEYWLVRPIDLTGFIDRICEQSWG